MIFSELEKDEIKAKERAKIEIEKTKKELTQIETKLEKLLDVYLGEVISAEDYKVRKEKMLNQKLEIQEKITDFEQKDVSWLEPAREFVLSLNKADTLLGSDNYSEMTSFLKNIGSNHLLQNRQLIFKPVIPYDLIAERSEATSETLPFPKVSAREESNLDLGIRSPSFFPLNYERILFSKAGEGNRTLVKTLEGSGFSIKLHPQSSFAKASEDTIGLPGFEPGLKRPKRLVLPLYYSPPIILFY